MNNPWKVLIILVLLILNIGAVGLFYFSKNEFDGFVSSFKFATENSKKWNGLRASADAVLPQADTAGEDLEEVGRYKGSIRISYLENATGKIAKYQTLDRPEQVLAFFKSVLAKTNWLLKESSEEKIEFIKDKATITITAAQDQSGITTYTISK